MKKFKDGAVVLAIILGFAWCLFLAISASVLVWKELFG
jgi:hypothetical protein